MILLLYITGETPLLVAVKRNDEIMIQFLLDLHAHPDITDFKRQTPLIHAAKRGFIEAVQTLLNANADISILDLEEKNVLFACLSDGTFRQQECFSIIMSKRMPDINEMTALGKPLLVAACENAVIMEKICLILLKRDADVNAIDKETGKTALHAACASGSIKVVRELLQRKANVNARDLQQQTPVHAALTSNVFELLPMLSAYNARFDLADQTLNTPVHLAAKLNQGKAIKFMVQRGAIKQIFIQTITSSMLEQIDKQCLFYEVMKNDKPEIFSLHFLNEQECLRLHKFIYHCIQKLKEQESLSITTGAHQLLTPVTNSNEDPTLSLKRLLNISSQNELSLPPSEFKQSKPMNREHFQNVFLHLIQNNDEFLDIIHQACFSSSTQ
ncbi:unnamed protein product [Adineta steineri]|uniref:mRNA-decapping enzyme C-terminal domain-containing protein n=1 Tax=Adineta steineri TaxID=433720 RepID=A0A814QQT1_9BILA|nr:unnamed protein product [Adineta steineri]